MFPFIETALAAIFVILLLLFITVSGNMRANGRTVERVERKLDLVINHLGIKGLPADGIPLDILAEIDRCIWSDRRIEAIKLYRQATGATLADAKAWVDQRSASY
ncbi:hypothetical protein C8K30_10635 [Promicromonospora sp. AC04]|uniref:hypothetical protein n=1 Tax=Promicromonospora sp. AC04 TaxID=2135723 RepID=UPI000D4F635C|nr:hypothetical protein [Promicromonospora sp. AC04]PUB25948.1 hypothetical protein C8K30_10635 [Promicromonospora sp. AC04]